ncbi:MAG: hypothetical protein ABRQ27_11875 [Clostridiaceae bacterium]
MKAYKNYIPIEISIKEKNKSECRIKNIISILLIINVILMPFSIEKIIYIYTSRNDMEVRNDKKIKIINEEKIKYLLDISKSQNISFSAENNNFYMKILKNDYSDQSIESIIRADEAGKISIKTIDYSDSCIEIRGEY